MAEEMQQGSDYVEEEVNNDVEPKAKMDVKIVAIIGVVVMVIVIGGLLYLKSQGKLGGGTDSATTDVSGDAPEWFDDIEAETSNTEEVNGTTDDVYFDEGWVDDNETSQAMTASSNIEDEKILELRSLGYTGDEIEYYLNYGMDFDSMVSEAKKVQRTKQEEIIDEVNSKSTGLYKKLLDMTWMGGKKTTVQNIKHESDIVLYTYIENVDYVKCDARGDQLFIRCTLDNGNNVFMTVGPKRWKEMKKSGNIVIQYTVETYKDTRIITDITEVVQNLGEYNEE